MASFVENAFDGFIGVNPDTKKKDAFIAGYKVALLDIKRVFGDKSIFDGVKYVNETLEKLSAEVK